MGLSVMQQILNKIIINYLEWNYHVLEISFKIIY